KKKEGKPRKKKDRKKNRDSGGSSDHHHHGQHNKLETTATAEGQIMAQVLSTFSRLEQSRFEAFRRATFPRDAIAKYVAHCLIEEQHRPVSQGDATAAAKESWEMPRTKPLREPILSEVVAPGQAEDISVVVASLAKAYAQRLVTAARRQANIRSTAEAAAAAAASENGNSQFSTPNKNSSPRKASPQVSAITPEDIMKAFEERQAQGLDPGFFLQPLQQSQSVLADNDVHQQKRLAALYAQEQYDKLHGGPPPSDDEQDEKPKGDDATTK
ncbi:MAG: hypothetical protein SGILL_010106, partial [Bacillariaceae sp.]